MADDASTATVVVALPAADDPVHGIGDEQKHATIVFLGKDLPADEVAAVKSAVADYVADGDLAAFTEQVTGVESLGEDGARVWVIDSEDGLADIHDDLVAHPAIAALRAKTDQFPSYKPHVTVGYPAEGSTSLDDSTEKAAAGVDSIRFDRLAVWSGTDQTEHALTESRGGTMTAPVVERSFTTKQRKAAAKAGTAMSDGSFPISTKDDLANAVSAYGRAGDKAAAKRHIIKRARALGAVSSLPDDWNVTESLVVHETATLSEKATQGETGRWVVQAISAGLGSSGYYSPDVLERAATNGLIGEGTPLFFDHPTKSDAKDRPERSVRDIAAVFTAPAVYDSAKQSLVGEVQVFGPYRDLVSEMAPFIGLSIWGSATDITEGMVDGKRMKVVEDLHAISSVDLVTKAGRGGEFLSLLESARAEVDRQAEAAGAPVGEATYSDIQSALCDAVREEYGADNTYAWVRDFDDTTVWFEITAHGSSDALFGQAYTFDAVSTEASLTGTRTEVRAVTTYVPAVRPGEPTTESHKENQMGTKQIEESEYTRLVEDAGRATTLEAALTKTQGELTKAQGDLTEAQAALIPNKDLRERITSLVTENAMLRAREVAVPMIAEALEDALIGDAARKRIAGELLGGIALKETDQGQRILDTAVLTEAINAKVRVAEAEAQELREAMGMGAQGQPRGLGRPSGGLLVEQKLTEYTDTTSDAIGKAFGLSETAAKTAGKGRI